MIRLFKFFLFLILVSHCSLNSKSSFWTKSQKTTKETTKILEKIYLSKKEEILNKELNPNLEINLPIISSKKNLVNRLYNNEKFNYDGDLEDISKFKFSKIKNFDRFEPEILFFINDVIFFDDKGSILKFDNYSKLLWKKNYYSKRQKKQQPILFFTANNKTLIVADNIAKFYAIDINSGALLWERNNSSPFNSEIKIKDDKFFVVDFENTLRSFSIKDGSEIWKVKTQKAFMKSQKKLSLIIIDKIIYFTNSIGDISAVDIDSGNLLWQSSTHVTQTTANLFYLRTSSLVTDGESIIVSNNQNEYFSFDAKAGFLNWKQTINSDLRSTIVGDLIFTVSNEGFLLIIDTPTGNLIRSTDLFGKFRSNYKKGSLKKGAFFNNKKMNPLYLFDKKTKNKNQKKSNMTSFEATGFILGKKNIYLSTDHGRLFIIDIKNGLTKSIVKINNKKISRPLVLNQNLFLVSDKSIIKLN